MSFIVPAEIEAYAERHTTPLPPLLVELSEATHKSMKFPQMLSGQLEGSLLQFLLWLSGARRVLEIGTFTGFSAQMMAAALPEDGQVITCEIDPKHREFAQKFIDRGPHARKIEIRLGPAIESIKKLSGPFDLVFIDADKTSYISYYEAALPLLSPKGVIAVDNVLWSGRVLDPKDESDRAIAAFNDHVHRDPRVRHVILTVRDGVMLIRRA